MIENHVFTFKVGDTACLTSDSSCHMTVARVPSAANLDLLTPMQVECIWLNKNHEMQCCRFPLAMLRKTEKKSIGFKLPDNDPF